MYYLKIVIDLIFKNDDYYKKLKIKCNYLYLKWDLIKSFYLKQKNYDDVIISASPTFLLEPICRRLNITYLIASKVDKHTGKYTGINCYGSEKVRRFKEIFPNQSIDNFYSDSLSDAPIAKLAKHAFLVSKKHIKNWEP